MIEVTAKDKHKVLQQFIRMNPFSLVILLRKTSVNHIVEAVNDKAISLFGHPAKDMLAASYLGDNWQSLLPFIEKEVTETIPICLPNQDLIMFYQQPLLVNSEQYILLVLHQQPHLEQTVLDDGTIKVGDFQALQKQWPAMLRIDQSFHIACIIVDIDRFKKFNESLGKRQADYLLLLFSEKLQQFSSAHCQLYRMNGDKFMFVMQYVHEREMETLLNRLFAFLNEPFVVEDQDYFVSVSIGITTEMILQEPKLDQMIHEAEKALRYVKKHDRGSYRFYNEEMSEDFPNEALMEAHLRRAIELDELFVHFQPQKSLLTGRVDSFEALIRWKNGKFGFVSPGQFIPLAESSGLILPIGHWVLERVCQYMQEWTSKGYRPVRIAVNISPRQFRQIDFVQNLRDLIIKYDINPCMLELEITESSMTNAQETTRILSQLKELGVFVSVDDFGTGYSSLSYLKNYPIDIIKIDQSFIADITKDKKNEAIVRAIILLSHTLGLEVIAEGVEEPFQERFLMEHNCQKVQGYLYNKPLPVEQVVHQYFMN